MIKKIIKFKELWDTSRFYKFQIVLIPLIILQFVFLLVTFFISINMVTNAITIIISIQASIFLLTLFSLVAIVLHKVIVDKKQKK